MTAKQNTAALFVSYRGGSSAQGSAARILQSRNVPYIVLSSHTKTPLTENAAVRLMIPSYEVQSDNIATFFSQECFSFYLNLLYSIVYTRSYLENSERKKEIDFVTSGQSHFTKND